MTRILRISAFAGALSFVVTAVSNPAQAQRYSPYCVQFSDGSGMDCSYPSLQSCLASVSGVGGICNPNPRSPNQPPPPPGFLQRLMQGNGPAFAPIDVGPPPDSGLPPATTATRPTGNDGRYCATLNDGSFNCGYPSFASCRAAVSGVGGTCAVNPRAPQAGLHVLPRPPASY